MANYITPEIKATFIDVIGKLREDIGREVIAIGASTTVDCPNCSMDPLKKRSTGIYSPTSPYPSGLVTTKYPSGIPAAIDFNATGSRMCPVCLGAGTLETVANRSKIVCMITQLTPEEAALTSLGKNYRRNYELQTSIETKSKFELAQTLLVDGFVSYVTSIEPAGIGDLTQIIVYAGSN